MRLPLIVLAAGLAGSSLAVSDARACAIAVPADSFVHLTGEETLIVWDAAKGIEHFVRTPTFEGDPATFGFFVPTPETPKIEKSDPTILTRMAALAQPRMPRAVRGVEEALAAAPAAAAPVEVKQRVNIDDFEIVSLAANDADAMGAWLKKNGFVDKPALRAWAQPYVARGYIMNAMRYAGVKDRAAKKAETLRAPTLRLSFAAKEPFYPYVEPTYDHADVRAFAQRTGASARSRKMDLYFVATQPFRATIEGTPGGPQVTQVRDVETADLSAALSDTSGWGFDPNSRARWTITHFTDTAEVRTAKSDVVFVPIGPDTPDQGQLPAAKPRREKSPGASVEAPNKRKKSKQVLFGAVALLAIGAALLALRDSTQK